MFDQPIELLLLHPLPFDGRLWRDLERHLPHLRTHTPTLYSLGETLEEVAARVVEMVTARRLIVVGNSLGGSCALEVAAAIPDRVEHLVLVGAKADHRPEPDYRDRALRLLARHGVAALWDEVWQPLFSTATPRAVVDRARRAALALPADAVAAGITLFHGRRGLGHVVDGWTKPLTVVTGADDPTPGRRRSEELARRAPDGTLHVVPDCGHYVPIERPTALARILDDAVDAALSAARRSDPARARRPEPPGSPGGRRRSTA